MNCLSDTHASVTLARLHSRVVTADFAEAGAPPEPWHSPVQGAGARP
jgi:hypothetical protein